MTSFIESEFGYCPLIWLSIVEVPTTKISYLHEFSLIFFKITLVLLKLDE